MTSRPYVLLSAAASLDGYIDDAGAGRLILSNDEDFDRVDAVRASVDAILIGATTIRADDPRLLVRSEERRAERVAAGRPATPVKITLTATGDIDPGALFFTTGAVDKIVYTTDSGTPTLTERLAGVATVVSLGTSISPATLLNDLAGRGVERLMVEGGGAIHTMFLTAGLVDELHLVYAPFFVGDQEAPRFVRPGTFPQNVHHRMVLAETRAIGDCVFLRYFPHPSRRDNDTLHPRVNSG